MLPRGGRSTKILESDSKFLDSAREAVRLTESPRGRRLIFPAPKAKFITSSHNHTLNSQPTAHNGHLENPVNTSLHHSTLHHPNAIMMPRPISQDFPVYDAADSVVTLARPKSQNIAIKRSRGCEDSNHHDNSTENLYDWATWRMYHRITSARRSRIASIAPITSYSYDMATTPVSLQNESVSPTRSDDSQSAPCLSTIDYSHLGEVFEIEM